MDKYFRVPWMFFSVAALIGFFLRWHLTYPIDGINFQYFLHAHSHLMFLGWIINFLMLAFVYSFIPTLWKPRFHYLFIIIQVLLVLMAISFPLQGYGVFSIIFSTFHTVVLAIFIIRFFKDSKHLKSPCSLWFVRASMIFFLISAIGPFTLGPIMMMGYGQTKWYYFAVYYYLHFQYNGVFTFGVLALFFQLLEQKKIVYSTAYVKRFGKLLAIACVPAYFLSTLWAAPGLVFNVIGFVAGALQLVALVILMKLIFSISTSDWNKFSKLTRIILLLSGIAFTIKVFLQLGSAHPVIATMAYDIRSFMIGYLHLVLIGFITFFIVAWYVEHALLKNAGIPFGVFLFAFVVMEIGLLLQPVADVGILLLADSVLIVLSVWIMTYTIWVGSKAKMKFD